MDTEALLQAFLAQNPSAGAADLALCLWQKHYGDPDGDGGKPVGGVLTGAPKGAPIPLTERLVRVPAGFGRLSVRTMVRLEALAAEWADHDAAALQTEMAQMQDFCRRTGRKADGYLLVYRAAGSPKPNHSEAFLKNSAPYRIVPREVAAYEALLTRLEEALRKGKPVTVTIDGNSGAGKSTLAEVLAAAFGGNVIHMDDFFLQPFQRTPERYAQPGGNVDYERFAGEVAAGLASHQAFTYRKFDCRRMALGETVRVEPAQLTVVEGSYSMHPAIPMQRDIRVFLGIDPVTQYQRILHRNGQGMARRFLETWIPLENAYFAGCDVIARCDTVYFNT